MNLINGLSSSLIVIIGLVACGGGSTEGNCVNIGTPDVGYYNKFELTFTQSPIYNQSPIDNPTMMEFTHLSNSSTFNSYKLVTSYPKNSSFESHTVYDSFKYTIKNNFFYVTERNVHFEKISNNISDVKYLYSPYALEKTDRACENKTWTSTYRMDGKHFDITGNIVDSNSHGESEVRIIESINEEKKVKAGTYKTIRIKNNNSSGVTTLWINIETGQYILAEARNSSGDLIIKTELISETKK